MVIRVIYKNGEVGTVRPGDLEALITSQRIYSFKRSSGWVDVSQGPLRKNQSQSIALPERRAGTAFQHLLEVTET
jgi:hypothetical protein